MGRPVRTNQAGAVDGKAYGQFLDGDIVDDLVIAALQEGRVDRCKRFHPRRGKPRSEGHRMLFGNADIKTAVRETPTEGIDPGSARHRGGNGDDGLVLFRFADQ